MVMLPSSRLLPCRRNVLVVVCAGTLLFAGQNLMVPTAYLRISESPHEGWIRRTRSDDSDFDRHPTKEHIKEGIISEKPLDFYQKIRDEIDAEDPFARCQRYGFKYLNRTEPRRIFYGALIANEPWELFEIAGAETYGMFAGLVFVEGNRTQNFSPRTARRLSHGPALAKIFGVPSDRVQVRLHVNEDENRFKDDVDVYLSREQFQRSSILLGWKDLGMLPDDLAYLSDSDEIFSRDFFRALQYCDAIKHFDYQRGKCKHTETGIKATVLIFESSPECINKGRVGWKPDVFLGRCIEGFGDESKNPKAPRPRPDSMDRARGWGDHGQNWDAENNVTDGRYPLYSAADMRRIGGVEKLRARAQEGYSIYTGYHFHNFFSDSDAIRTKYRTYGHPSGNTGYAFHLGDIHEDLDLVSRCVKNDTSPPKTGYYFVEGGLMGQLPSHPIYFLDPDYRRKRHELVSYMVEEDEREWRLHNGNSSNGNVAVVASG